MVGSYTLCKQTLSVNIVRAYEKINLHRHVSSNLLAFFF